MWMMCTAFGVGWAIVDEILAALFHCDYSFDHSRETAERYSEALDEMEEAERAIKKELSPESRALVTAYQEKVQQFQMADCQVEFERGFLMGARLILGLMTRRAARPKQ